MGLIRIAKSARDKLTRVARSRSDKRRARRAKALLALHHGKSVQQVADGVAGLAQGTAQALADHPVVFYEQ